MIDDSEAESNPMRSVIRDVAVGGVAGSAASDIGKGLSPAVLETLMSEWYNTSIQYQVILNGENYQDTRLHSHKIRTDMFECMQQAYKQWQMQAIGVVMVLYADSSTGKTHSSTYLLDKIAAEKPLKRGLYVSGGKNREISYDLAVANMIGVPKGVGGNFTWIKTLCKTLSGDAPETITSETINQGQNFLSWVTEILQNGLRLLGIWQEADTEADDSSENNSNRPRPANQVGVYPPILVLDDFDTATEVEMKFVKELAQQAYLNRIFVLILTDNIEAAQKICQQNKLERITPLLNSYSQPGGEELKLGDKICWKSFRWSRKQLTELAGKVTDLQEFPESAFDSDGCLSVVEAGMSPIRALKAVDEYLSQMVPQNISGLSS